jgi:hypothetical protein
MEAMLSLRQFVQRYTDMRREEDNLDGEAENNRWVYLQSAVFALTGHDGRRQHTIATLQNRFDPTQQFPTFKRDHDFLIGFTPSIPVDPDIVIFPVSSFQGSVYLTERKLSQNPYRLIRKMPTADNLANRD